MKIKERIKGIIDGLANTYPGAECSLAYKKPYELLFSTRLSAQCTDARVNIVTKDLFKKYKSLDEFANADLTELENMVRPCGFFHTKAKDIKMTAGVLLEKYNGQVPDNMEELTELPGVGRKTANLILGDVYGKPAIVADTHCIRLSNRLGLVDSTDPYKVELKLKEIIPEDEQTILCHRFVWHGRATCTARSPKCDVCAIQDYCPKIIKVK